MTKAELQAEVERLQKEVYYLRLSRRVEELGVSGTYDEYRAALEELEEIEQLAETERQP